MTEFAGIIRRMTSAAAAGDGAAVGACFTEDGVYHDVFYGDFAGRDAIRRMIEGHFHRDGADFIWDIHDPVEADGVGYARYVFSYRSRLPDAGPRRACFEGVAICRMRDGLIADYREVANAVTGLSLIGIDDARLARFAAREAAALLARDEAKAHRG